MTDLDMQRVESILTEDLPPAPPSAAFIREMLTYSLESGGKRVRPQLCLMFCEACGGTSADAAYFAAAVEYVHTYSLIHDDLPCMDNDDYRRGKPSSHKRFGEANALLAGDGLLTHAFTLAAQAETAAGLDPAVCLEAVRRLSFLAGVAGMIGGQYLDLKSEGSSLSGKELLEMDSLKTGALIEAACVLGCLAGGGKRDELDAAAVFARRLGVAFQIKDDLLEYDSDEEDSDERNEKSTYVSVFGPERAFTLARTFTAEAIDALSVFGSRGDALRRFADALLNRDR